MKSIFGVTPLITDATAPVVGDTFQADQGIRVFQLVMRSEAPSPSAFALVHIDGSLDGENFAELGSVTVSGSATDSVVIGYSVGGPICAPFRYVRARAAELDGGSLTVLAGV